MKEQFTQGDWGFRANDSYIELHAGDKQIGDLAMGQNTCTKEELEANARLFKLAPKMYEMLQEWVMHVDNGDTDHAIINEHVAIITRELLAEARGENNE